MDLLIEKELLKYKTHLIDQEYFKFLANSIKYFDL